MAAPRTTRYESKRHLMKDGDLLLFRGRGWISRLIRRAGRCPYSHVGMVHVDSREDSDDKPIVKLLEVREWYGGRCVLLENEIEKRPGQIDWWPLDDRRYPDFDRHAAVLQMYRFAGRKYGWLNVLRVALSRAALTRLFFPAITDDRYRTDLPPFCSHAVALAAEAGGVDVADCLAPASTEPCDLMRSGVWVRGATRLVLRGAS